MRCVALFCLILFGVGACGTAKIKDAEFVPPNSLMGREIGNRISQIPYQHREELFNNLLWLSQSGEQAIPALLEGLRHTEPKVRSNCAWVLGQIRDRRVIMQIRPLVRDRNESVRLEAARTLVQLGDIKYCPILIEGLDSQKIQVRYLCHMALKAATGRDFNYDHLVEDKAIRAETVHSWRKWWAEQSGDEGFAKSYAAKHGLDVGLGVDPWDPNPGLAAPDGETMHDPDSTDPDTDSGVQNFDGWTRDDGSDTNKRGQSKEGDSFLRSENPKTSRPSILPLPGKRG